MQQVRTTLRLRKDLKKMADTMALEEETTLQAIFNNALENYLKGHTKKKSVHPFSESKKINFKTHDLGEPLDNLTRNDIYGDPENVN